MNWIVKSFEELSTTELYAILKLRSEVFVVEQNCPYQDLDDKDLKSYHLLGWKNDLLAAYTRLLPADISYPGMPSIGRVVTSPATRGAGIGRELMNISIEKIYALFGEQNIKIGAQLYLKEFYTSLGFTQTSDEYLEDGIPHVEMTLFI